MFLQDCSHLLNYVSVLVWPHWHLKALGQGGVDVLLICTALLQEQQALPQSKADSLGWLCLK